MDFFFILITWLVLSPFLKFFYHHQFLFFLLLGGGVWLYRRRHPKTTQPIATPTSSVDIVDDKLVDVLILRAELARQHEARNIDRTLYEEITQKIDTVCDKALAAHDIMPDSQRWRDGREAAWQRLMRQHANALVSPPWRKSNESSQEQLSLPFAPRTATETPAPFTSEHPTATFIPPSLQAPSPVIVCPVAIETAEQLQQAPIVSAPSSVTGSDSISFSHTASISDSNPLSEPSVLERTLQTISGWPALLVPFLVQNILWFICGLCFVAGSTSLIASTSGQTNILAVSLVLLTYSGFLLWIGYRLCRTKPELTTSGSVLLALGVLLIPLNIASVVRLLATAQTGSWIALGTCLVVVELFGFYYATMLVSGVMDRFLQGRHPQLFLVLTAVQVMVPVLSWYPSWPALALTHCVLLGLLAYGVWQFTHDWLHSILDERRKVSFYAIGTLVYAALVSYVHVTWGSVDSVTFPAGYASPFLMAICGLLFYVDAQLKQWTKRYTFLSHVSFLLYGLSIIALLLCITAPQARTITLCLSLLVYSVVVWQYLTFVPLVLLLGCAGWLYHTLFLQQLHPQWHLLASLPGLIGVLSANRWLQHRRQTSLTASCFQDWFGVTVLLCLWSLGHAQPGIVALTTVLVTMGLTYVALESAPTTTALITNSNSTDLRHSPWLYTVMGLGTIAVAYAPQWAPGNWTIQTASGLIVLSLIWTGCGLHLYRQGNTAHAQQAAVLLNSAILNLILSLLLTSTLALPHLTQYRTLPVLLTAMSGALLWLSLTLRVRGLFYGVLMLWGLASLLVKWTYFPQPGSGGVEMMFALVTWTILWWLEHESDENRELRRAALAARAQLLPPLQLLWQFPIASNSTYATLLRLPLQQTMILLWLIGITRVAGTFIAGTMGWGWTSAAIMGMVGAVLGAGYFRLPLFIAVAVWLGLGAWLALAFLIGFSHAAELGFAGVLFALLVWRLSRTLLNHPRTPHVATWLHLTGNRSSIEIIVHWTTIVGAIWCVVTTLLFTGVFTASGALFSALLSLILFLGLAGWHNQRQAHSYLALALVSFIALLSYSWSVLPLHGSLHSLFRDQHVGLLAAVTGLVFWMAAWELGIQRDRRHTQVISCLWQLYHTPLCHTALFLAVFALNQQLALVWLDPLRGMTGLAITTLLLGSIVLFSTSFTLGHLSLQIAAILSVALAVLWEETLLVHPEIEFRFWPGGAGTADQWLTLSLVVTGFALLAFHFRQLPKRLSYAKPISRATAILYTWTILGPLLFHFGAPLHADLRISLSLLALAFSLFPLLQPLTEASAIRGVTLPLLSYPLLVTLLVWTPFAQQLNISALLWGFFLWATANFMGPRWNARFPQWAVTTDVWPWFGLLAVILSLAYAFVSPLLVHVPARLQQRTLLLQAGYLTAGAAYCFLMLRNSTWRGFSWIGAFLLTRVGVLIIAAWWAAPLAVVAETSVILLLLHPPIGELLWLNLLLLIASWWNRHGETFAKKLGWQEHPLPLPFVMLPAGYFVLRLAHLTVLVAGGMTSRLFPAGEVQWLDLCVFAALLTLSFFHVLRRYQRSWVAHALFLSALCTLFIGWTAWVFPVFHFPFFLTLWSAALLATHSLWEKRQWGSESTSLLERALSQWVEPSLIAAIVALSLFSIPLYEQLLALLVLIDSAAVLGWQRQQRHWLIVAAGMSLVFLHDWPLLWVPFAQITLLLPWYALQLALIAWLLLYVSRTVQRGEQGITAKNTTSPDETQTTRFSYLSWAWKTAACIATVEWSLHLVSFLSTLAADRSPQWLMEHGDICAAFLAALVLIGLGIPQIQATQRSSWIYGTALLTGAVGLYARLLLVGLAPASAWDTTVLLIAAYAVFILYHVVRLTPLLHIVMFMPFLLVATIPWQLASAQAGTALMAAAALYFLTHRETERRLPLYLAFATVNAALYLWIPVWATHYQVVQLYLTPAALSVLLLAHLHRYELPSQILNGVRLAATATLFVSATSDVFFHPGVGVFLVALALSLAGVLVGIASRIRAFLYTGMISLVGNIAWQLLMLFPEQRLSQAVILLTLAVLLAGAMTWFNMKREDILQRVRVFQSDLETWA